jgi:hypothetical protein
MRIGRAIGGSVLGLLAAVLVVVIWSNPLGSWTVIYCPVTEQVDAWPFSERKIVRSDVTGADQLEFMVHDGELYLAVQATRPSLFITTFVDFARWDATSVRAFRDRYPELESMWPTPARDDGGVRWAGAGKG